MAIIKIDFQPLENKIVIQHVVDFLEMYNFTYRDEVEEGESRLIRTYSKYFQSGYIDAEDYGLIRAISKDGWRSVKQAFISLVEHGFNNTESMMIGDPWLMEMIPPNTENYTPIRLPLLGFALRVSYRRECNDVTEGCDLIRE